MLGVDLATGIPALPWWAVLMLVSMIGVIVAIMVQRNELRATTGRLIQISLAVLGLFLAWNFLDVLAMKDRAEERRGLDARLSALTSRALAPGSALACLEAMAGDMVEDACEKALFATPESVAAGVSYVTARLNLLADALDLINRGEEGYEQQVAELRRAAEIDRFGIVAHVLMSRNHCIPDQCDAFGLLRDTSRIIVNMKARAFDAQVARHVDAWRIPAQDEIAGIGGAMASSTRPAPPSRVPATVTPSSAMVNFPSAASIPPVSIMTNEPGMTGQTGTDPEPKAEAKSEGKSEGKPEGKSSIPTPRAAAKPARRGSANQAGSSGPIAPLPPSAASTGAPIRTQ